MFLSILYDIKEEKHNLFILLIVKMSAIFKVRIYTRNKNIGGAMSSARQKQGNANINTSRKRIFAVSAIMMGAVLIVISAALFLSGGGAGMGQDARFTKYLNEKYGQEFVVENVRVTGAGLGVQGSWRGDAYPKSDPSIRFEVRGSQPTGEVDFETFLQTLWTKQASSSVEEFLSVQLPESEGFHLQVTAGSSVRSSFYQSVKGRTPNLAEMLDKHKDQLSYNLIVRGVVHVSAEEPASERLDEAFKVASFARGVGINRTNAGYIYRDSSFKEKDKVGQQLYQYSIGAENDGLRDLQTASDLNKYFKKLR